MSGLKEIRRRISSVSNTKQITRAMKLVSAAKLRKAQDAAIGSRDYAAKLNNILAELKSALPKSYSHPLLEKRDEIKKQRLIFISGERGLCGGFNVNSQKALAAHLDSTRKETEVEVVAIGRRAVLSSKSMKLELVRAIEGQGEDISQWPLIEIANQAARDYQSGKIDEVVLIYTMFKSAVSQVVTTSSLLPFDFGQAEASETKEAPKCDPVSTAIVAKLIPALVQSQLTQAALESKASEHAARMTAMDSATRNASELIEKLKLHYNRARQSAITTELIDIVGGAEATN